MKKGLIWGILTFLLVTSLVLASCNKATTTTTSVTQTTTAPTTTTTTKTTTTVITIPPSSTSTTQTSGHWWDSMGTPTYGGQLIERVGANFTTWDPYTSTNGTAGYAGYLSQLFNGDYSVDPKIWDFSIGWLPSQYAKGYMLTGWEMPNAYTVVLHLRQDIIWQNIAPANGRQFVASDVVAHYSRILGLNGYPKDPYYATVTGWAPLTSIVANDKFTVTFNWTPGTSPVNILTIMQAGGADNSIECPEVVAANTTASSPYITNWRAAVGTGPYMLSDFVDSSSATYVKNPNYWGTDLRWPQNKLPYLDSFKMLVIPNASTALAAFRVGKIDTYGNMFVPDALPLMKTNPEIIAKQKPQGNEYTLDPRNDVKPFNDINVRIALQHAIDIPTIASQYYSGYATPWPASLTENQMGLGGWGVAYPDWPQATKDQYTYDPALAKKMLADAGFPNGFTTNLVLESDAEVDLYNIVKSELAAVGVNMSIQLMDPASWQSYCMTSHKYDALCARNQGLMGFNFDIFRQFMRYGVPGYQSNYILVDDKVCQKAYNDALVAQSVDEVQKLLQNVNLYIATQHFVISLAQPSSFNMVQPWIKGNAGSNTLGSATTGSGFGDGCPMAIWVDQAMKTKLGH
jgi:peptide/nickel transport system substrate-binding protein